MNDISYKKLYLICLIFCCSILFCNTRVGFSRPGSIIRTPGIIEHEQFNQYIIGFSGEVTHATDLNYASSIYFHSLLADKYHFGLTYNRPASIDIDYIAPPSFASFHIHTQIYKRNNIGINLGIHDVLYESQNDHQISLFALFSYNQPISVDYNIETTFGFGTGYLSFDSHRYTDSSTNTMNNLFVGLKLHTPLMSKNGGVKFLLEYDGWGINMGTSLPVSPAWTIQIGITHLENLAQFGDWDANNTIYQNTPALALGFQMNIPKVKYKKINSSITGLNTIYNQLPYDESIDSLVRHATVLVESLEDSLLFKHQESTSLNMENQLLNQQINSLEDSLRHLKLDLVISEVNLNKAMKYLSNSLNLYYTQNYSLALEETDKAINIYPNLAIAYARKGSIYYKLNDIKRATINWNIALKLDPEYQEVRNVLMEIKQNSSIKENIKLPE